jgi:hypothetical protein
MKARRLSALAVGAIAAALQPNCIAQTAPASAPAPAPAVFSPAVLPGNGLAQHPFLYAGETERRRPIQTISLVRDGRVGWTYSIPSKDKDGRTQEIGDVWRLSNGNIIFSHETGTTEITPDKKIVWSYDAPPGHEVHTIQPVDGERVFLAVNGLPAQALIINTITGKIEKSAVIPTIPASRPHSQFRRVRLTAAGTILATHLEEGRVAEYDWQGRELWSYTAPSAWAATRLKNGDTLVSREHYGVVEVNPQGRTVWQFTQADVPDIKLFSTQEASRLANGDTLICNWVPGSVPLDQWPKVVQILEVTPDKKVVWAVRSWAGDADLGPASSVQLLDEPGSPEKPGDIQR